MKIPNLKQSGVGILALLVFFPQISSAETVLRSGHNVSVESEQVVAGDYYVSVGPFSSTIMSGTITEDMYAFGLEVTTNGKVGADATLLGGVIDVHGPVGDDLRVFGSEVTIAEHVEGDVFVFGRVVNILSTASVGGDVFVFGDSARIEGPVGGSVFGQVEHLTINTTVAGNVDAEAPLGFVLGDNAEIAGDVYYMSDMPIGRSPAAIVGGALNEKAAVTKDGRERAREILLPLFILLFTTLSLYLLFKPQLQQLMRIAQNESGQSLLIGALTLIAGPVVALVLMVTVLGFFIGFALSGLLVVLLVVSIALTGPVLGVMCMRLFSPQAKLSLSSIVLGTVLLYTALFIPIVGLFMLVVLVCITLGGLTLMLYRAVN